MQINRNAKEVRQREMKKVRQLRTVVRMKDLVRHRKSEIDAE